MLVETTTRWPLDTAKRAAGSKYARDFPDTGAALDHEVMLVVDGVGYGVEHFLLFRAVLKASERSGERPLRAEHPVDFKLSEVVEAILGAALLRGLETLRYLLVIQTGWPYRCRGSGMFRRHS